MHHSVRWRLCTIPLPLHHAGMCRSRSCIVKTLLRTLALLVLALACATPAVAKPALWAVRDADTTIYLFGTVHLLPNDTEWRFPVLERALAGSDVLYEEIVDDDTVHVQALVLRYGLDLDHPLSSLLTAHEQATLAAAARTVGLPAGALQVMRPWLAGLTLAVAPLLKAGLDPAHGVDKLLRAQMTAAGKPVRGLETAEQQVRLLADMPPSMQLAFLRSTLHDFGEAGPQLAAIIGAWKDGDVAAIAHSEDAELKQRSPELYQRLLVARNVRWARQIAAMLKRPGTVFVAVGAAHLAGPDSVQAQLGKLGIAAQRL
jgi:uncharacterized protein YbaP (TraB family)